MNDAELRSWALALVEEHGFVKASKMMRVGREALARFIAGMPVRLGTVTLIESYRVYLEGRAR